MKKSTILLFILFISVYSNAQNFKIEDNQLVLDKQILFKTATAEILKESEDVLKNIKQYLDDKSYISTMRIEGHVAEGAGKQTLSEQRALAVANWLIKNGVDCKRLMAVGFGDTKPIAANDSPEKTNNTRIVFAMSALRGRAIGGMPLDGGGKSAGEVCQ